MSTSDSQHATTTPLSWPIEMNLNLGGPSILSGSGSPHFGQDMLLGNRGYVSQFDLAGDLGLVGQYKETVRGLPSGPILLQGLFALNATTDTKRLQEP